jgi:hypothetical protein
MINMPLILLLSLFSPLAELFPNHYMSWWRPSNDKLKKYLDAGKLRLILVTLVWFPILITLAKIVDHQITIGLIGALVFSAFGLRLYFFNKSLRQELRENSSAIEISRIPEFLYIVTFLIIGFVIYTNVLVNQWLVPLAILLIFLGATMISTFRKRKNLTLDVVGRIIFTLGFLLNLYNLIQAVSL